jgi:hypothetical protein
VYDILKKEMEMLKCWENVLMEKQKRELKKTANKDINEMVSEEEEEKDFVIEEEKCRVKTY